jgi:hypothetical protein
MRFHGLMVLRDEQDILVENLNHLLSWADTIFILDTGSTDGSWEIVQEMAKKDKRIVPFKQTPYIFSDILRGYVFHQYRDRFDPGDWVLRVYADEFYAVTPPQFVQQRMRPLETAVWLQWYYFRILQHEVDNYESGKVDLQKDRLRPIAERRRYYKISEYAEPRMFRYRRGLRWPETESFPYHAGFVSRQRIPVRHYPHRDPLQMQARFNLRAQMVKLEAVRRGPDHWKVQDWRAEIMDETGKPGMTTRGIAAEPGIDTGPLLYWKPGTPWQEQPMTNHLTKPLRRIVQRIMHPALLPILDPRHPGWSPAFEPPKIPEEMQPRLTR